MIYYKTSVFTYNEFLKENKTNRISKTEKIISDGSGVVKYLKIDKLGEIFNSNVEKLDYTKETYVSESGEENIIYFFDSIKGNKYRLDLVILKEDNDNLKDTRLHDKKFISVSFSKFDATEEDYDNPTNKYELYDVMSRIKYLIKLNEYKTKDGYIFMFGKPIENKINIYENFIKVCFPDYRLIKDYTSGFPNTNIGYYFIK